MIPSPVFVQRVDARPATGWPAEWRAWMITGEHLWCVQVDDDGGVIDTTSSASRDIVSLFDNDLRIFLFRLVNKGAP